MSFRKLPGWTILFSCLCLCVLPLRAQQNAARAVLTAPGYAGAEACRNCHAAEYDSWSKSRHWETSNDTRGGAAQVTRITAIIFPPERY